MEVGPLKESENAQAIARFRFYGNLNDFLLPIRRHVWFTYSFKGSPAVKDTIESMGIPHVEVDGILVDDEPVGFYYQLRGGEKVAIYPEDDHNSRVSKGKQLKPKFLLKPRFVLDSHLGKLARYLRLLGFDTLYRRDYADKDIARTGQKENRIVLTRDIGLLKNKIITRGYWVRSTDPKKQIKEVLKRFPPTTALSSTGMPVGE